MATDNNLMPSSLDRQLSAPERDAFGHRHFAQGLRSLIESEDHTPPFSVGLLGGWGTGKSTIKELYVSELMDDTRKDTRRRTRADRFHSITFNAWRFGGREQDIKRALLRHVFLELGGDEENLQDRLFRQVTESSEEPKGWCEYTLEVLRAWAMPLPAFLVSLALLLGLVWLLLSFIPIEDNLSRSLLATSFVLAYSYLFKQIKSPPVPTNNPITRIALPSTTAEQYEDLLIAQLRKFKSGDSTTPDGRKGIACERLVVFVDDLDRLSAEEMVLGLDAVRTFMEIPEARLPKGLGVVFVISCDEAKVAHALAARRRQGDMPGTVFSQTDARRYLDRIFQFRLEIPPFPRQDMREYALRQMRDLPAIEADLRTRGVPIETVVDRMIHVGVQDPRNALQIVNAFAQAWWLAKKRETEELGTGRAGGLYEDAVTAHPVALGALSAIKVNFPDFYRDLQGDPALLHRVTDVIVRKKPLVDQPPATQQLLTEHYLDTTNGDSSLIEVRSEHRLLRQFLASLIGLRWPHSLQSLLLLSQDPISRKFGARATAIYDALLSGDTQGVLEGLGRHDDAKQLRPDEARLLYQMTEELRLESAARRSNASRVVADLVDRLPEEPARLLLGSLCRELGDSIDLRSQLGLHKIAKVLDIAHPNDRSAIASCLVQDVLTLDDDLKLRLETMEQPNLSEALEFARHTVDLVLPIRRDHGLAPSPDAQLLTWLVDRTVRANGKYHQLPFSELEGWMMDHEDHLLQALTQHYTNALADELERDDPLEFDPSSAITRASRVFEGLFNGNWRSDEDTRPTLWKNLIRYVSLKLPEASQVAWETMSNHVSAPDTSEVSAFVTAFVERLKQDFHDSDREFELELDSATEALLTLARSRLSDFDNSARDALSDLAILWSQLEETAEDSCCIVETLQQGEATEVQAVFENWSGRMLNDLPIACIKLIASSFPMLQSSSQSAIVEQLKHIINSDTIDESTGEQYRTFTEATPENAWREQPLKAHLDGVLSNLPNRHGNPNGYLHQVFPPIAALLQHATPTTLGQSLQNLFTQAKGQPSHFAWLHSMMVGHWPEPSKELKSYNPSLIFSEGQAFAVARPQSSSKGLLQSLQELLITASLPTEQCSNLISASCATWSAAPEQAVDTVISFPELTPEQAANLLEPIDWMDDEQPVLLAKAWDAVSQAQDHTKRLETTNHVLEKGPSGPDNDPDCGLRLWLDAQGDHRDTLLTAAIIQPDLNDAHRKRVWQHIVSISNNLSPSFFLNVIPQLIIIDSVEDTAATLFEEFDLVSSILGSPDHRADLSQRLMKAFTNVPTKTIKASIAEWCKKLSGDAALQKIEPTELTSEDLEILESHFRGAKKLKELRAKIQKKG